MVLKRGSLVSVNDLCPHSQKKFSHDNSTNIKLFHQSDSAAIVHHIWTKENINKSQNCAFAVDSNLYSPNGRYGHGLFASINTLKFRTDIRGNCIDYVQFIFNDGSRTAQLCGRYSAETVVRNYFGHRSGIINVYIFVNKSVPFHALQQSIELKLIFTSYQSEFYLKCSAYQIIAFEFKIENN